MSLTSFDFETWLIQPGLLAPPAVCASTADEIRGSERVLLKADALKELEYLLRSEKHIIGANFSFDLAVAAAEKPELLPLIFKALREGRIWDTHLLEPLHDNAVGCMFREPSGAPFASYHLERLVARHLGIDISEDKRGENSWRLRYWELDGKPLSEYPPEAVRYSRQDARETIDVGVKQLAEGRENIQCHAQEMKAAFFLHLASVWGMRTDPVMVAEKIAAIRKEHETTRRKFLQAGISRIKTCGKDETPDAITAADIKLAKDNLTAIGFTEAIEDLEKAEKALAKGKPVRFAANTSRLKHLVNTAYQGNPPGTPGGDISISRDTLVESGDPLLEEYGESGANEKLLSTYAAVLEQGTKVPINPRVNVLVATQRSSYREPNLQNLPRKGGIRECFVPRAGWLYSSVDYGTIELCTLAQVCLNLFGASKLADALNAGRDLHLQLAARIMGISYEDAQARKKAKDKTIADMRQSAKPVNFGLPGLMGPPKLVFTARKDGVYFCELSGESKECAENERVTEYAGRTIAPTCRVCLRKAIEYRKLWLAEWPEMEDYFKVTTECAERCADGEPIESFGTGMKRLETNAGAVSNHFFQNLAAQGLKEAEGRLAEEAYSDRTSVLYNSWRPVVAVHDETIGEAREEVAAECSQRQADIMLESMKIYVPDVKITAAPTLMRRWFKGAEPVYDRNGRLKPWWPVDKDGKLTWDWAPDREIALRDIAA